jgi:hypothetical protein
MKLQNYLLLDTQSGQIIRSIQGQQEHILPKLLRIAVSRLTLAIYMSMRCTSRFHVRTSALLSRSSEFALSCIQYGVKLQPIHVAPLA